MLPPLRFRDVPLSGAASLRRTAGWTMAKNAAVRSRVAQSPLSPAGCRDTTSAKRSAATKMKTGSASSRRRSWNRHPTGIQPKLQPRPWAANWCNAWTGPRSWAIAAWAFTPIPISTSINFGLIGSGLRISQMRSRSRPLGSRFRSTSCVGDRPAVQTPPSGKPRGRHELPPSHLQRSRLKL